MKILKKLKNILLFCVITSLLFNSISFSAFAEENVPTNDEENIQTNYEFVYTGDVQEFTVPFTGRYYFELYGASGANASLKYGGAGGYTYGYCDLIKGTKLYITCGGVGSGRNGGYNGGGNSDTGYGGGGCTVVSTKSFGIVDIAKNKDDILFVAGGGAGAGIRLSANEYIIGNGGGIGVQTHRAYAHGGHYDRYGVNYNAAGLGQNGINGGGAGGGGFLGGGGFDGSNPGQGNCIAGGYGGSGYIGNKAKNAMSANSQHIGSGTCLIKYESKVETEVVINLGKGASYNGQNTVKLSGYAGESIELPEIEFSPEFTLSEYSQQYGDATINGNVVTFGIENSCFQALYATELTLKSHVNGDKLSLEFHEDDDLVKYFRGYESLDGETWDYIDAGSEKQNDNKVSKSFSYAGRVESFTCGASAVYTFDVYGASGGGSVCQGHGTGANGYGGFTHGTKFIKAGETIYIAVGGQGGGGRIGGTAGGGWNGGGSGSWDGNDDEAAGGGGGATSITTTNRGVLSNFNSYRNEVILVAGGGGGREYDYGGGQGGGLQGSSCHGRVATQSTGYAFGRGENGSGSGADSDGCGGGGGGWFGGYSSNGRGCGQNAGGGSGYIGGLDTGYTQTSTHTGGGYVTISYVDRRFEGTSLDDVTIKDKNAPNMPTNAGVVSYSTEQTMIGWTDNGDNGTTYYHKVESYNANTNEQIHTSNITEDFIISGIKGYYYSVNSSDNYTCTAKDTFVENPFATIDITGQKQVLHVAAVDNAGNISQTYNYRIPLYFDVVCIDRDIATGAEIGRSTVPPDCSEYVMMGNKFYTGQIVKAESWGTDEDYGKYYDDYYYKKDSATSVIVQSGLNVVYRDFVPCKVFSSQINIAGDNVYKDPSDAKGKTYFVKPDIPFVLDYTGYTLYTENNFMLTDVQYNILYNLDEQDRFAHINFNENSTNIFHNNGLNILNIKNSSLNRYDNNLKGLFKQECSVDEDKDNKKIEVIPSAKAEYVYNETTIISSDKNTVNTDKEHNLFIICDSAAPLINVPEKFDENSSEYNPLIEGDVTIPITYADYIKDVNLSNPEYGSGVDLSNIKVTLIQEQTDNGGDPLIKIYTKDTVNNIVDITNSNNYSGEINIKINPQSYEDMSGFITVKIEMTDNVGNTTDKEFRFLVMNLDASIQNISTSEYNGTNQFMAGENGMVGIETNGFVDQVSIVFPSELQELAEKEIVLSGEYDEDEQLSQLSADIGRIFNETYPRDNNGNITRVTPNLQTKLWGSSHKGGMQWNGSDYEHCYLKHFFYAPIYSNPGIYDVYVIAYKQDPKNPDKIYQISKKIDMSIGLVNGDVIDDITYTVRDRINDN